MYVDYVCYKQGNTVGVDLWLKTIGSKDWVLGNILISVGFTSDWFWSGLRMENPLVVGSPQGHNFWVSVIFR